MWYAPAPLPVSMEANDALEPPSRIAGAGAGAPPPRASRKRVASFWRARREASRFRMSAASMRLRGTCKSAEVREVREAGGEGRRCEEARRRGEGCEEARMRGCEEGRGGEEAGVEGLNDAK